MTAAVFYIDPSDEVPVYRQLMDQIRLQIATGDLAVGDELPSTRTLGSELGVNPMTVSKAYSLLEREDVLDRRPGKPLVVAPLPSSRIEGDRKELLRESLEPAARMVRQLGLDRDDAADIFRRMLPPARKGPRRTGQLKEE